MRLMVTTAVRVLQQVVQVEFNPHYFQVIKIPTQVGIFLSARKFVEGA